MSGQRSSRCVRIVSTLNLATTSDSLASMSVIFPFPSSPHWAPKMAVPAITSPFL